MEPFIGAGEYSLVPPGHRRGTTTCGGGELRCRGMNVHPAVRFGEKMVATRSLPKGGRRGVRARTHPGRRSLDPGRAGRIAQLAQDAAESLDVRIEDEDLDGQAEVVEVREALERLQALSLEVSEELDAYQQRYARAR